MVEVMENDDYSEERTEALRQKSIYNCAFWTKLGIKTKS